MTLATRPTSDTAPIQQLRDAEEIARAREHAELRLMRKGLPESWAEPGIVFEDEYLQVRRDPVRFPDGRLGTYLRVLEKPLESDGVAVLPLYQGQVVLLRHFRYATGHWHLEIPRGFGHEGAAPEQSATIELAEEIGATISSLTSLGDLHPNTGLSPSVTRLWLANLVDIGEPDRNEGISSIVLLPVTEVKKRIASSEITDSYTIAAIARADYSGLI